jgi:hypothetical protein
LSFYGSQWFIEVFISFRHWTISWSTCIHSTPSLPICWDPF